MEKLCVLGLLIMVMLPVSAEPVYVQVNRDDDYLKESQKYEYLYMNPPKKSLYAQGRYIFLSSGVRYTHSPSKRKRAAHAARIDAYNYDAGNY